MLAREMAGQSHARPVRSLGAVSGWRAYGLAAALGALAGLAFAPLNLVPAFALGISGLVWLGAEAPSRRKAFAVGWWWGLGISRSTATGSRNPSWSMPRVSVG